MRVAVTGGAGFIGSHVVDRLVAAGHEVVVLDVHPPHRADVEFRSTDILDLDALMRGLEGCGAVFHLAGVANVNDAAEDPVRTVELNVMGTAQVWEAARRCGVDRAILASTVWVYGAAPGEGTVDEGSDFDLARAGHVYTSSKLAAELMVRSYRELYGQEFTILRYGIPYGPRMREELVIARFVKSALDGVPITVHGDGSQYRNYIYVEDMAEAHVLALGAAGTDEVFNLEGAVPVTVRELVEAISAVVPNEVSVEFTESRAGDYAGRAISADRAKDILGWEPTVSFEEGLGRYVDWYEAGRSAPAAEPARQVPVPVPAPDRTSRLPLTVAAVLAVLVLPGLVVDGWSTSSVALRVLAVLSAAAAALAVRRIMPRPAPALAGFVTAVAALWLLAQVDGPLIIAVAVLLGAGVALAAPTSSAPAGRAAPVVTMAVAGGIVALYAFAQPSAFVFWVAAGLVVFGAREAIATQMRGVWPAGWMRRGLGLASMSLTAMLILVVGATSADASWFGTTVTHGSRHEDSIALTFDTTNAATTVAVAKVLEAQGVTGTFFTSGKDVGSAPGVAQAILQANQVVGNGTFDRDPTQLFDLSARQERDTQHVLFVKLGVCPQFFRPPNGDHTPFMARAVHHDGMAMVIWDVNVDAGPTTRADAISRLVVDQARPGSIIRIDLTRSGPDGGQAVVDALPGIIAALRGHGLDPVALDTLLHRPAYSPHC